MKKAEFSGLTLRADNTIQITMYFGGKRETETIGYLDHSKTSQKKCYAMKLEAEEGYKKHNLNYAKIFPESKKKHKYVSFRGDNISIIDRLDERIELLRKRTRLGNLSVSTLETYITEIGRIKAYFNQFYTGIRLSELKSGTLKKWAIHRNISQKAINEELKHFRAIINDAIGNNELNNNILYGWKPKVSGQVVIGADSEGVAIIKPKHNKTPFTPEEVNRILESTKVLYPEFYSFNLFRFALGMRPGEIRGLEWSKYNELDESIIIIKTIVKNKVKLTPKTKAGIRPLKLNKAALRAIQIQKELTYFDGGYIFTNPDGCYDGKFWGEGAVTKRWKKILRHANIAHRRPYTTRHSFIVESLKSSDISAYNLSRVVGHKNTKTIDKYIEGQNDIRPLDTSFTDGVIKLN